VINKRWFLNYSASKDQCYCFALIFYIAGKKMNIQTGLFRVLLLLFTCFAFSAQNPINAQITRLENGDQISWDGQYYEFKDADGRKMIKLWVPPGDQPVKGILISGHGGGSGDSRQFARDKKQSK
jgi:hypothetical protein